MPSLAVYVGACEPGVPERAGGGLGVQLRERFVVGLARGMLKDASDVGLALDRQVRGRDRGSSARCATSASGGRSDGRSAADRCRALWAGSVSSRRCRQRAIATVGRIRIRRDDPLTEADYQKAIEAGGFTGTTIVGTDLATLRPPPK